MGFRRWYNRRYNLKIIDMKIQILKGNSLYHIPDEWKKAKIEELLHHRTYFEKGGRFAKNGRKSK